MPDASVPDDLGEVWFDARMSRDAHMTSADAGTDAGPAPCETEGETRAVECGNCGLGQERCEDGSWVLGECLNEKDCAPGELEREELGMCAARARICDAECAWGEWDQVSEAGECEAGAMRMWAQGCAVDETKAQMCTASCEWEDVGTCTSACPGTRRTSPAMAEEVCIPAGPFVRGDDEFDDAPEAEVMITYSFFIDRFPISNGRYRECVEAGTCTELPTLTANYNDPTLADYPAGGFGWEAARTFCEWDGRRLPTEAEWEKAARGPAPRDQPWTWGDTYDCDVLPSLPDCPDPTPPPSATLGVEPAELWPGTRTFYGVDGMAGISTDWTSDWYGEGYYSMPSSLVDPEGPATGTLRVFRSSLRSGGHRQLRLGFRRSTLPSAAAVGIRCARSAT